MQIQLQQRHVTLYIAWLLYRVTALNATDLQSAGAVPNTDHLIVTELLAVHTPAVRNWLDN